LVILVSGISIYTYAIIIRESLVLWTTWLPWLYQ
jgi:hypothetical protein